jgi:hypothetical protein
MFNRKERKKGIEILRALRVLRGEKNNINLDDTEL